MKSIKRKLNNELVAVTIPMTVRAEGVDHSPFEGVKVYAFDGTTYKGYSGTSGKDGQVTFTLPQGNYRFRGDLNGTQFWSGAENHCTMPGCSSASIVLPGGNTSRSAVTIAYTYDGLSRLTAADYSSGDYYHYAYDAVGNRLTETTAEGETAYTYDPANRLTSVNGLAVQWDDNGNMLADGQAVYKYNTSNKLVGVTKGTSSIVYAYSGLGDRLKQIADGVTTDYTLDINAGLTQVLQDGKQTYLYGNQRIAQIAETQTGYFLPDALGSMRQMTDSSADLTLARTYDPYGNVVSSSGAGETVYGYTGEQQSSDGSVFLRERYYKNGRFLTRDSWNGDDNNPESYNKWLYVDSNPITRNDPSGRCWITNDPSNPINWLYFIVPPWGERCSDEIINANISELPTLPPLPTPQPTSTPTICPTVNIPTPTKIFIDPLERYGIIAEGMNKDEQNHILVAAKMIGKKLALIGNSYIYANPVDEYFADGDHSILAFRYYVIHDKKNLKVSINPNYDLSDNCMASGGYEIKCKIAPQVFNAIHEIGHILDYNYRGAGMISGYLPTYNSNLPLDVFKDSFLKDAKPSRAHPKDYSKIEIFADLFMNWILTDYPEYTENGFIRPERDYVLNGKSYSTMYDYLQNDFMPTFIK